MCCVGPPADRRGPRRLPDGGIVSGRPTRLIVTVTEPAGYTYSGHSEERLGWRSALAWARCLIACGHTVTIRERGVYRDTAPAFGPRTVAS